MRITQKAASLKGAGHFSTEKVTYQQAFELHECVVVDTLRKSQLRACLQGNGKRGILNKR
jgi:hypothetical protein